MNYHEDKIFKRNTQKILFVTALLPVYFISLRSINYNSMCKKTELFPWFFSRLLKILNFQLSTEREYI